MSQNWIKPELDSDGYWICPDKAVMLEDQTFQILGRSQADFIKVKGEGIFLGQLKKKIEDQTDFARLYPWELLACPHDRDGYRLRIVYGGTECDLAKQSVLKWNFTCLNFERIELVVISEKLWPRTAIGKIHLSELQHQVCQLDPCDFLSSN
jgi:acyl-coenzyme A synthetase/AMP-(fatty) acid ligase